MVACDLQVIVELHEAIVKAWVGHAGMFSSVAAASRASFLKWHP